MLNNPKNSGIVTIIGEVNVGKSSLLNILVKKDVSIITHKSNTTNKQIKGIKSYKNSQIVFIDTPGLYINKGKTNRNFLSEIWSAVTEADFLCIVVDGNRNVSNVVYQLLEQINEKNFPKKRIILAINKIDLIEKEKLLIIVKNIQEIFKFKNVFMVSAKKGQGCNYLINFLQTTLPNSPFLYDKDQLTDLSERVFASEITREKLFNYLNSELPYNLFVETAMWKETKNSITIHQNINVSKYNHKRIIIGKNGENLKKIGISSRKDLEKVFNKKVNLFLFIKIKNNWMNNIKALNHLGQN